MRFEQGQQDNQRGQTSTNGSSQNGSSPHMNGSARSNGETNGFHGNGAARAATPDTSPYHGHNREEVTRIILQALSDLGYQGAAQQLSRESGYQLEIPSVAAFRNAVLLGQWDEAEMLLFGTDAADQEGGVSLGNGHTAGSSSRRKSRQSFGSPTGSAGLPLSEDANTTRLKFLLRQQKYLELLEQRDLQTGLSVLRNELTPLKWNIRRVHYLTSLVMKPTAEAVRSDAEWDGAQGNSRNDLLSEMSKSISPSVMIPEHQLATLLAALQQERILKCTYHNTTDPPSLYTDHECHLDDFPLVTSTELKNQTDEVWYLEFSHNGSLLATAGKDGLVNVYETKRWQCVHEFREHEQSAGPNDAKGVCYVAFSPDDRYLISCSQNNEFVVMDVTNGLMVCRADHFDYPVTSAAWLPDSLQFVVGTQSSRHPLGLYSLATNTNQQITHEIHSFREPPYVNDGRRDEPSNVFRVTDVAVSRDGSRMAACTTDDRIMIYDLHTRTKICERLMESKLTSINYSRDGELLLVNTSDPVMNMGVIWILDSETAADNMPIQGAKMGEFIVRSCFGGAGENFILSGSEDSHAYIWRRQTGEQVAALEAHTPGIVNAVAWHPNLHGMFATAGDDRRVRIWMSEKESAAY